MNRPDPDHANAGSDAIATAAWHAGLEAGEHLAAARHTQTALATLQSLTVDQIAECVTALTALLSARTARQTPRSRRLHLVQTDKTAVSL